MYDEPEANNYTPTVKSPPLFDLLASPVGSIGNGFKIIVWGVLGGVLAVLIVVYFLSRKTKGTKTILKRR